MGLRDRLRSAEERDLINYCIAMLTRFIKRLSSRKLRRNEELEKGGNFPHFNISNN